MPLLQRLTLHGFRSVASLDLELRPRTVLIGANGAGKSNLIAFFKMLNDMMAGRLQMHIAESGRAQSLLHDGPKKTPSCEATLEFLTEQGLNFYHQKLRHVAGDTLAFETETLHFERAAHKGPSKSPMTLGSGHLETRIGDFADQGEATAKVFRYLLNRCRVFHFHDTSPTARARAYCQVGHDRWLAHDGGNLAAMLYRFQSWEGHPAYRRILGTVRQVAPFLADFVLEPTGPGGREIILNWRNAASEEVLGAHQLSDGTLRFIALAALFLQPRELLPDVILIDEPELGLHPAALNLLHGMVQSASNHCQVILATQSPALVDAFAPEDVVVVNWSNGSSTFERLQEEPLKEWLEDYTLGQLWEKNVVGGGPHG